MKVLHIHQDIFNTMTSLKFALHLTCFSLASTQQLKLSPSVRQETERRFVSANVGDKVTLRCFCEGEAAWLYWYKQTLGHKPRLISTFYVYGLRITFYNEFKNNSRFTLDTESKNLTIFYLNISDSATYYCATSNAVVLDFAEGTFINVKGSGLKVSATVHQSVSESIQPGGSVTLDCTVHTGTCDGEHSVYWFKKSEESQPGLIYTHGGRTDQCEWKNNTQTHTCVYKLPMKSLNISHAGTYYCAVASCGHILFGNGTKLEFEDKVDSPVYVYFLSGALTFTTILVVLLAFSLFKMNQRNLCRCTEVKFILINNLFISQDVDNLHYAALSVNLPNRSRRQRNNTNSECVYSGVKQ
uniref:Ig-like domain-containing protein n=1 Tax=Sander lucioperca TaxID=283035 RepID=A0A8C9X3P5_SANLU